jgi:hypothetical protein
VPSPLNLFANPIAARQTGHITYLGCFEYDHLSIYPMQRICNMVSPAIGIAHRVPCISALAAQISLTKQASTGCLYFGFSAELPVSGVEYRNEWCEYICISARVACSRLRRRTHLVLLLSPDCGNGILYAYGSSESCEVACLGGNTGVTCGGPDAIQTYTVGLASLLFSYNGWITAHLL